MIVNGKSYDIETLLKSIDKTSHEFKSVGNLMLTKREISILDHNFIDYQSCSTLKDLMIKIEDVLEDECIDACDAEDLDYVLEQISERNYYENVRK